MIRLLLSDKRHFETLLKKWHTKVKIVGVIKNIALVVLA